nr:putative cleavage and polyadenylation specificity factor subunit 2 [Quercus suber]
MFVFTPLLGAQSQSPASQSLLELDGGVKILVDVGWDDSFDVQKLEALEKHVSSLSIILLTHPTIGHLGAYAHCCKHIPLFGQIPVYATTPVINLGRTLLSDVYASSPLAASIVPSSSIAAVSFTSEDHAIITPNFLLEPPTADEIGRYFNLINPLKYSQPHQPIPSPSSPSLGGLVVTAYGAGYTLGGTIWHIQHGLESIVYASDWNQGRENLISGASWLSAATGGAEIIEPLRRPTALICSSKGVTKTTSTPRKKRDETLISLIRECISQGGKVLIPSDSSARILELAFVLNQTWQENADGRHADTYKNCRVYLASRSSVSTIRYLQSMLEWVEDSVRVEGEAIMTKGEGQAKALNWHYIKQLERISQVENVLKRRRPCVLLASDTSMEWGFSKLALETLAADPKNLLVLTESASRNGEEIGLGRQLWNLWESQAGHVSASSGAKIVDTDGRSLDMRNVVLQHLSPEEDAQHQQYIARQHQMHGVSHGDDAHPEAATSTELVDEQAESSESEDEDEDTEQQGRALNLSAQLTQSNKRKVGLSDADLGVNILLRSKTVHDYDVRYKRGREKMFPFAPTRNRVDDFGEAIKPEEYLRAEERDEIDAVDMRDNVKQETTVGQKRSWDDKSQASAKGQRNDKSHSKRLKVEVIRKREPDDIDALIAQATGQDAPNLTGAPNGAAGADEESATDESDYEPEEPTAQGPQKVVFHTSRLTLKLRITHVDFAGLHEKRDLQMLIPLIRPRKLILIGGEETETSTLANECRQLLAGETSADVFTPQASQTVDASVDTNAWTLKLSRPMVKKLTWQNVKGLGVVALTGRLEPGQADSKPEDASDEESAAKKQKLLTPANASRPFTNALGATILPVLDLPSSNPAAASAALATRPVHVGDLRLASLRELMRASGHTAEFRGEGTLLIDATVVVRKSASGKIEVEAAQGGLQLPGFRTRDNEGSFYAVRKVIYGGLAIVAGV